jgi:serine/threonine-protein kinase
LPDPTAEEHAARLVGKVISQRYRIDELLARGGMGAVYKGYHLLLKKRVAIKVLHPEMENLPELVARFEREAIAGAHISHPGIAAATDFGQLDDGSYFLVLEYVSGRTLHRLIKKGRLSPAQAAGIARQIAAALGAAHAIGVVHRDVKPRNIMLSDEQPEAVKVIDFGLAKVPVDRVVAPPSVRPPAASLVDGAVAPRPRRKLDSVQDSKPRLTGVGVIVGTIAYLAPEAALGMDAVDARADLYALGIVMYEMLAGVHPFDAADDAGLFAQQRFQKPPLIAERAPGADVPPALEAVVMRLLEKEPAARYQTAAEVIEAIDAAMPAAQAAPAREEAAPAPPPAEKGKPPYLAITGAAAFLIGVVAVLALRNPAANTGVSEEVRAPASTIAPATASPAASPTPAATASAAPSAEPAASAAPSASATATASEGGDAAAQRTLLLRALRVRDYSGGEAAFLDLASHDPAAFHTADMMVAARDLAVALDRSGKGDRIFEVLAGKLGPDGLDILYDLVATKGKSSASLRAAALLRQPEVIARASPELRVAFALREAPCVDKLALLERAVHEGDERALIVLQTQGVACFRKNNKQVREAMSALRSRLNKGQ